MRRPFVEPDTSRFEIAGLHPDNLRQSWPLTEDAALAKGAPMHKTHILAVAITGAALALSACNTEPEVVTINEFDPMADELAKAGQVEPPPMISHSRTFRCRDNSLVYIDFYTNNTAAVRTDRGQPPVATLTAEGGNPPFTGDGFSVSANAEEISLTAPGKGTQTCHT